MAQFNINVTPEFERDLKRFMKKRGIEQKSEAVRQALREALDATKLTREKTDFSRWRGLALKGAPNPNPRFVTEDDLWDPEK